MLVMRVVHVRSARTICKCNISTVTLSVGGQVVRLGDTIAIRTMCLCRNFVLAPYCRGENWADITESRSDMFTARMACPKYFGYVSAVGG